MYTAAIIPAAGFGLRVKNRISKPLIKIKGIPILIYTLKAISRHPYIKEIIVVANQSNIRAVKSKIKQYRIRKISDIVLGGETRRLSVENGLKALRGRADFVLIHDAVRPFIQQNVISKVIDKASRYGAAVVGVPVKATIKKVSAVHRAGQSNFTVKKTLDRENIWEIQTPQVFRRDIILKAYNRFKDNSVTDDASLVERLGVRVQVVMGSNFNIKITTTEDLMLAKTLLLRNLNKFV